jgi:hypothetical protein
MIGNVAADEAGDEEREPVCYLCGEELAGRLVDRDHVPPRQFFAPSLRRARNPNLLTLDVHRECHKGYGHDEAYFVYAIGSVAHWTPAGTALFDDTIHAAMARPGFGARITRQTFDEFSLQIRGIWLPPGKAAKSFDPDRVYRVVWKIVRGLYFHETGQLLPERQLVRYVLYTREDPPGIVPLVHLVLGTPPRVAVHDDVFQYWRLEHDIAGRTWHAWALLFWQGVMFVAVFHEPGCPCQDCADYRVGQGGEIEV